MKSRTSQAQFRGTHFVRRFAVTLFYGLSPRKERLGFSLSSMPQNSDLLTLASRRGSRADTVLVLRRSLLQSGKAGQILPSSTRMMTIIRIVPRPPLGPYPHLLLCGHVGSAPMRRRMRTTSRMVFITTYRMRSADWLHPQKEFRAVWQSGRGAYLGATFRRQGCGARGFGNAWRLSGTGQSCVREFSICEYRETSAKKKGASVSRHALF